MLTPKILEFLIFILLWNYLLQYLEGYQINDPYHDIVLAEVRVKGRGLPSYIAKNKISPFAEKDTKFWFKKAQCSVKQRTNGRHFINKKAKNIIFFLGDGMSIGTVTAARILKGQGQGLPGEETVLNIEKFPFTGLSKTYCTNGQTADSACSATAYLCGVKANLLTIGVNAHVNFNNCTESSNPKYHVDSLALWSQREGKSTGIVTTTTVTHASPSGNYAHVANRNWESDKDILKTKAIRGEEKPCLDIARQLIEKEPGRHFNVIFGGGYKKFIPHNETDPFGVKGCRKDGLNLIEKWKHQNPDGKFVTTLKDLSEVDFQETQKLMGLFHSSHMEYNVKAKETHPQQPRLKDMTEAAIKILNKNPKGYFVFIEGGRIDHGHHSNIAGYALDETLEFDEAIKTAMDMTQEEETLIVITSDHSHSMTMSGYPGRGNPILGWNKYNRDLDGIPYSVLNYALGPEQYFDTDGKRLDLSEINDDFMIKPSYIRTKAGAHAGEDVAIFARGPQAYLFTGTMEQNVIPHLMAYASCVGKGYRFCND